MTTTATAERPEMMNVLDTTAQAAPRTHTILVNGLEVNHTFHAGTPLTLPFAHAMRFVAIPSFVVTDPANGDRISPPADPKKSETTLGVILDDGEVVARLDELHIDALILRANLIPGGEGMSKRSGKDAVLAFLADHLRSRKTAARKDAAKPEKGEMSPADLDKMFGE